MYLARALPLCLSVAFAAGSAVAAQSADVIGKAFADHCFSPYLTAETAQEHLKPSGARIDFYDLRPFSASAKSPVTGRAATTGTDRRCEVAFDGDNPTAIAPWLVYGLAQEGLADRQIAVPQSFPALPTAQIKTAVQLNPNRIAVIQSGVRDGAHGPEVYINVERLTPLDEATQ